MIMSGFSGDHGGPSMVSMRAEIRFPMLTSQHNAWMLANTP